MQESNPKENFWEQKGDENDAVLKETYKATLSIIENSNQQDCFDKMIAIETYHQRGFIKNGELVRSTERLFELPDKAIQSIKTDDGWNINVYPDDVFIAITGGNDLSKDEIESALLKFLALNAKKLDCRKAVIYVFNMFRDEDVKLPPHKNNCVEFKGCFVFIKAEKSWVLVKYNKVIYFPPEI